MIALIKALLEKNPTLAVIVAVLVSGGTGTGIGALASPSAAVLEVKIQSIEKDQARIWEKLDNIDSKIDMLISRRR